MFETAARDAAHRSPVVMADTLKALDEIARRAGLATAWEQIRASVVPCCPPALPALGVDVAGGNLMVDGAALGLRSVADASVFVGSVLHAGTLRGLGKEISGQPGGPACLPAQSGCAVAGALEKAPSANQRSSGLGEYATGRAWAASLFELRSRVRDAWHGLWSQLGAGATNAAGHLERSCAHSSRASVTNAVCLVSAAIASRASVATATRAWYRTRGRVSDSRDTAIQ